MQSNHLHLPEIDWEKLKNAPLKEQQRVISAIRYLEAESRKVIEPQPGGQQEFFDTKADIVFYGGEAMGGKTWGLIAEPLLHIGDPNFRCVIFRRVSPQITNPGGLWDEARELYRIHGGIPHESRLEYRFPSGARIKFGHMQYEQDMYQWQGAQITEVNFDEATHFTKNQFFYLASRNRSKASVRHRINATCNPDADSWVAAFLQWWWNPNTGYAISERSGVIRWFALADDVFHWADSREELVLKFGDSIKDFSPTSVTFIIGRRTENLQGLKHNPNYEARLAALPYVERARLKDGNWKIRAGGGNIFKLHWFEDHLYDTIPADIEARVRSWDLGGSDSPKADYTVGLLMAKSTEKHYYVEDIQRGQWSSKERWAQLKRTALEDLTNYGRGVRWRIEWVPGIASEYIDDLVRNLLDLGIAVVHFKPHGKKASRAQPVSAATEGGYVHLLRNAPWRTAFQNEAIAFSDNPKDYEKDDQMDGLSDAYNDLNTPTIEFNIQMI